MAMLSTAKRPSEAPTADLAVLRTPAEEALLTRYPAVKEREARWGGSAVARLREEAFAALKANGLPNRRVEEWKYTDLRALMREPVELAPPPSAAQVERARKLAPSLAVPEAARILFVNGVGGPLAAPEGFACFSLRAGDALPAELAEALTRPRSFADNTAVALNTAFCTDWTVLRVPANTRLAQPLLLEFRSLGETAQASFPRVLVVVEEGAAATVIETVESASGIAHQSISLVEILAADGASVEHVRVNTAGDRTLALSTFAARLDAEARLSSLSFTTGAAASRYQVFATLAGAGAQASIRGATLLRGTQHCDSTLVVDHVAGGGMSRETFKTVLDGASRGVFQGRINVAPGAQKTDGKMAAHALLLSPEAEADAKPELEIFADDVVCGHGATAGALDEELLFYLKARGIPAKEAEALLVQAFVGEAIEPVENEAVREILTAAAERWLQARG